METKGRIATRITVYWDTQVPDSEGWAYRFADDDGDIESGALDSAPENISQAIGEAIQISGMSLTEDQFAVEPNLDGGFAIWTKA